MQLLVEYSVSFSQKHLYYYILYCSHLKYTGLNKTGQGPSSGGAYVLVQANEHVNFRKREILCGGLS